MPAGRPLKFKSVEELQEKIERWLEDCRKNNRPLVITGLAISLDTTRETLLDYQDRDEFSDTIIKAKQLCENYTEEYLFTGKNVAGAIFNLTNNFRNWKNKQYSDLTSGDKPIPILGVNVPNNHSNEEDISVKEED